MQEFERLGALYLGREHDLVGGRTLPQPMLVDSRDLTTHAVCVGMTGSGKTGLCIALLEEAAIDGVPAIAIDPKGDLGNLLLTFPGLRTEDFRPWIDAGEAERRGLSAEAYAEETATLWRDGLAEWGQDGSRIARLRDAAEFTIYTPGSTAGRPLAALRSLEPPAARVLEDPEALREHVVGSASALLTLVGIDADPLRSREHTLVANVLSARWSAGQRLDLPALIEGIRRPPFERVGVVDLETYYPEAERFELAVRVNTLLASPSFAGWLEGDPLDVPALLRTPEGKPRIAIVSIAHLPEAERMFVVTLLLQEIVTWVRAQPGTPSLRAILYMDEVFGYLPPTAQPPSKAPLLTLLKQARAHGLGVVLATQNPVDLDYKALSNAGLWFLGRLQTERDKARVLDGLAGAGGSFDRGAVDAALSSLEQRVFVVHDVRESAPSGLRTRWTMSYLRGPLTRDQIRALTPRTGTPRAKEPPAAQRPGPPGVVLASRPVVPPGIAEVFVDSGDSVSAYRPHLLTSARMHFVAGKYGVDLWSESAWLAPVPESAAADPWPAGTRLDVPPPVVPHPAAGASFAPLPDAALRPRSYAGWSRALAQHLYRTERLVVLHSAALRETSRPGESEAEFRGRLAQAAREKRDRDVDRLRKAYAPKIARLEDAVRRAEARVDREQSQYAQRRTEAAADVGASVLGALFGRRGSVASRATSAARGFGRAAREKDDVERARQDLDAQRGRLATLSEELRAETEPIRAVDAAAVEVERVEIAPRKSDLEVEAVRLAWVPD